MLSIYIFILVVFEGVLILSCNAWYYPKGVVVLRIATRFSDRIAPVEGQRFVLSPWSEEIKLVDLGSGNYAFRENTTFFLMPYLPVMRGMLSLDEQSQSLEVKGLLNATVPIVIVTCFLWATYDLIAPALLLTWIGVSYIIQRDRFRHVATQAAAHS